MALFVIPSEAISTIRDRSRSRTVALRDRDHRSRTSRSPLRKLDLDRLAHGSSLPTPLDPATKRNHKPYHRT